jgi:hypothetical protein
VVEKRSDDTTGQKSVDGADPNEVAETLRTLQVQGGIAGHPSSAVSLRSTAG